MHGTVALRDRNCGTASPITVITELLTGLCTAQIQASYYSHTLFTVCVLMLFAYVNVKYAVAKLVEAGRSRVRFPMG